MVQGFKLRYTGLSIDQHLNKSHVFIDRMVTGLLFTRQNGRKSEISCAFFLMDDIILPFLDAFLIM